MLPLSEVLPTPSGWTLVGHVAVGDILFTERGTTTTVTAVHPIDLRPAAVRLLFDDGSSVECCIDHLWLTYDSKELQALTKRTPAYREQRQAKRTSRALGRKSPAFLKAIDSHNKALGESARLPAPSGTVRSAAEICATLSLKSGQSNHAIPVAAPLQLPQVALPLDPYILGLWLGDGATKWGKFTSADPEIVSAFACQFKVRHYGKYDYGAHGLSTKLRAIGVLGKKHIPLAYQRASYEQRLALLQGLMDTDGTAATTGQVEFTSTNAELAYGVQELICGLGMKVRVRCGQAKLNGRVIGPNYRLKWTPNVDVFRLPRKLARQKISTRRVTRFRYIVGYEVVPPQPMRCLTVDNPSGLFLVGRTMIPTHNTDALLGDYARGIEVYGDAWHGVIFRLEYPMLDEIVKRSIEIFAPVYGEKCFNQTKYLWKFPTGATLKLRPLKNEKDVHKHHGAQYSWVGFDELTHWPTDWHYTYLWTRLRSPKGAPTYFRATGNPGGPGDSWVKKRFMTYNGQPLPPMTPVKVQCGSHRITRVFIPSKLTDNKILMQNDPHYLSRLDLIPNPALRRAMRDGDWSAFVGAAFEEWDPRVHIIKPHRPPEGALVWRSMDWGNTKPFACGWFYQNFDGRVILWHELYGGRADRPNEGLRMPASQVREMIEAFEGANGLYAVRGKLDPQCFYPTDSADAMPISEQLGGMALGWEPWPKGPNSRIIQKNQVHEYLKVVNGVSRFAVTEDCVHTIRTLPTLPISPKDKEDVDTDAEDHLYDMIRGALAWDIMTPERLRKATSWRKSQEEKHRRYQTVYGG